MKTTTGRFYPLFVALVLLFSCKDNSGQPSKVKDRNSVTNLTNQEVSIDSVNRFIDLKMTEMNITGLSLAIINDGEIAYHTVNGYADLEGKRLVNKQTLFEGASMAKRLCTTKIYPCLKCISRVY